MRNHTAVWPNPSLNWSANDRQHELKARHAPTASELRMLQSRPAARVDGSPHLLVRMHILRTVYEPGAPRSLPELRRRACISPAPPCHQARQVPGICRPCLQARGLCPSKVAMLASAFATRAMANAFHQGGRPTVTPNPSIERMHYGRASWCASRQAPQTRTSRK